MSRPRRHTRVHIRQALLKLRGLADFAGRFAGQFHRIEAVTKVKDVLRVLARRLSRPLDTYQARLRPV